MSAPLALRRDAFSAEIAPDCGGALVSLTLDGVDILRRGAPARIARDPREAALFVCVPWFGRIFGGLDFSGRRAALAPTLPACDPVNALHGEGWVRAWRIETHTDDCAVLALDHSGDEAARFPFPFSARQEIRLGAAGAAFALSVRNAGSDPMPAGLGFHPYFPRRRDTRLALAARGLWTPNAARAGGREGAIPADLDFRAPAPLPARAIDHTFTGCSGAARIERAGMRLRLETDAPFLHLYAPAGADFFCLEPATHRPGAFGGETLAPGETLSLTLRLEADRAGA